MQWVELNGKWSTVVKVKSHPEASQTCRITDRTRAANQRLAAAEVPDLTVDPEAHLLGQEHQAETEAETLIPGVTTVVARITAEQLAVSASTVNIARSQKRPSRQTLTVGPSIIPQKITSPNTKTGHQLKVRREPAD